MAVTSVALGSTLEALNASIQNANFGEVLFLSDRPPSGLPDHVGWRQIRRLASRLDYSEFMLRELADHIHTSHALCIQWDGFVLNGKAWDPGFLEYDYIGAVWPQFTDGHNVGNGGFSLRSRRLLQACKDLRFDQPQAEDLVICRLCRKRLESEGIRFAPADVARRFSFEREKSNGKEFGFHGAYNLVNHLSPEAAHRLFHSLEPQILARSERFELLRWAWRRRRFRLAAAMLTRLM